ncbi:MAG: hypothetical protein J4N96_11430, partial [Chloroflexi bacterium]|nr:hypothetical protein [Chloroflexota bacterium]
MLVKGTADEKWTLPGGWMDVNYSPAENVEREILEESGRTTRSNRRLQMPETWTGRTGIPVLPDLVHPSLNKHRYLLCHDV